MIESGFIRWLLKIPFVIVKPPYSANAVLAKGCLYGVVSFALR